MPKFTIDITDAALIKLQLVVARYNQNNGTTLTVEQFIHRNLMELAVQDELAAAVDALQREAQANAAAALQAAVAAARDELITAASAGTPPAPEGAAR
jgi:hypothetical protein